MRLRNRMRFQKYGLKAIRIGVYIFSIICALGTIFLLLKLTFIVAEETGTPAPYLLFLTAGVRL